MSIFPFVGSPMTMLTFYSTIFSGVSFVSWQIAETLKNLLEMWENSKSKMVFCKLFLNIIQFPFPCIYSFSFILIQVLNVARRKLGRILMLARIWYVFGETRSVLSTIMSETITGEWYWLKWPQYEPHLQFFPNIAPSDNYLLHFLIVTHRLTD